MLLARSDFQLSLNEVCWLSISCCAICASLQAIRLVADGHKPFAEHHMHMLLLANIRAREMECHRCKTGGERDCVSREKSQNVLSKRNEILIE
jgi:hypothetical protein